MITIYGQPGCQRCRLIGQYLEKRDVPYNYRDVSIDQGALDQVKLMGYQSVPVTAIGDMHWEGFRPDKMDRAIELLAGKYHHDDIELDEAATRYLMGN